MATLVYDALSLSSELKRPVGFSEVDKIREEENDGS